MGDTNVFITALLEDWGRVYFLHDIQLKHTHTHIHTREKLGLLSKQSIHIRKLFPPKTDMNERTTKK